MRSFRETIWLYPQPSERSKEGTAEIQSWGGIKIMQCCLLLLHVIKAFLPPKSQSFWCQNLMFSVSHNIPACALLKIGEEKLMKTHEEKSLTAMTLTNPVLSWAERNSVQFSWKGFSKMAWKYNPTLSHLKGCRLWRQWPSIKKSTHCCHLLSGLVELLLFWTELSLFFCDDFCILWCGC